MLKKILVPLDGSKVAEAVLPYVESLVSGLASEIKGEVTLFHVLSPTYYVVAGEAGAPVPYTEAELEQIKKKTMDYLDKVGEGLTSKGAIVECKVGVGRAADEINNFGCPYFVLCVAQVMTPQSCCTLFEAICIKETLLIDLE